MQAAWCVCNAQHGAAPSCVQPAWTAHEQIAVQELSRSPELCRLESPALNRRRASFSASIDSCGQGQDQQGAAEAHRLLRRQLIYTSCAYSSITVCIEGSPAFLQDLAPVLHELCKLASGLGAQLSILTATSPAATLVGLAAAFL